MTNKELQTVIRGQHCGRLVFKNRTCVPTGLGTRYVIDGIVYADFDEWIQADRDFRNLPSSSIHSTGKVFDREDPAEFRRECVKWLYERERKECPPVAVLATAKDEIL